MARSEQVKSTRFNHYWAQAIKLTSPISLEDLM